MRTHTRRRPRACRLCVRARRQEHEACIRETQMLHRFDSDRVVRYYDAFLEQVGGPNPKP
jgi:hypothetical protein